MELKLDQKNLKILFKKDPQKKFQQMISLVVELKFYFNLFIILIN